MNEQAPSSNPRPVFARHAASLLVLRRTSGGHEVLMGVRGAGHRFMPNRLVFPGGAVDRGDRTSPAAAEPRADVLGLLQRSAQPPLARAIVAAAARELTEETGLALGTPPRLDLVDYLCRAVTPPEVSMRFNARFLVAPADALSGTAADTEELHDLRFLALDQVLQQDLMLVTRQVLVRLDEWLALPERDRRSRRDAPVFRARRWSIE